MSGSAVQLTDGDIRTFIELCREKDGVTLDYDTAKAKLYRLVKGMEVIYHPISKEQAQAMNNEDENINERRRPKSFQ